MYEQCCYIMVNSATAASQNGACNRKMMIHFVIQEVKLLGRRRVRPLAESMIWPNWLPYNARAPFLATFKILVTAIGLQHLRGCAVEISQKIDKENLISSVAEPWHFGTDPCLWLMDPDPAMDSVFLLITFWRYIYIIFKDKKSYKSQKSKNQEFSYFSCLITEGSGSRVRSESGSVPLTNVSGSGSRRLKNIRILRIRIRNTAHMSIHLRSYVFLRYTLAYVCVWAPAENSGIIGVRM